MNLSEAFPKVPHELAGPPFFMDARVNAVVLPVAAKVMDPAQAPVFSFPDESR